MYDIIGDIHGHAPKLEKLLAKLGYKFSKGCYCHETRKVLFVGDFIDRGPEILRTLEIVKGMIDGGAAKAVMGNHEFNAIAYHTKDLKNGGHLRSHGPKHWNQHKETIRQLGSELDDWIGWFRELPFTLDIDGVRVVHACWDDGAIKCIEKAMIKHRSVNDAFMEEATKKTDPETDYSTLYWAIEWVLKGKELILPNGHMFTDNDGNSRNTLRVCWFGKPAGNNFHEYAFPPTGSISEIELSVPTSSLAKLNMVAGDGFFYPESNPPVFFGHYWMPPQNGHKAQASNVACVDYSVAKGGHLCAYRWNSEKILEPNNFVCV